MILFALFSLFIQAGSSHAGWISSGGELFKDAKNPWFLRNTPIVRYCVDVDQGTVTASRDSIRAAISQAFSYWALEFRKVTPSPAAQGLAEVATQEFIETDCQSGVHDLAFKVGYGTLQKDEKEFLGDVGRYIGVTVRTNYDLENLKGKGFIYIASDQGEFAYHSSGQLIPRAWEHPQLLQYAFLHEIGHVMGLAHQGAGLMSGVFLDQLLNRFLYADFLKSPVSSYFLADLKLTNCLLSGEQKKWFGAEYSDSCIEITRDADMEFTVYAGSGSAMRKIGGIRISNSDFLKKRETPSVYVFLGEKQKVFTEAQADFKPYMTAGRQAEVTSEAVYTSAAGQAKAVMLYLSPAQFQVVGVLQSKPKPVFRSDVWLSMRIEF